MHEFIYVEFERGNKPLPKGYAKDIPNKDLRRQYRKSYNIGKPLRLHCVKLDGYRAIGSFEAFRNKARNFSETRWYYAKGTREEFGMFDQKAYDGFEEIQHNSIYDFFNFIGYDYKTKKFGATK